MEDCCGIFKIQRTIYNRIMYNNYKTLQIQDKWTVESKSSTTSYSLRSKSWIITLINLYTKGTAILFSVSKTVE